MPPEDRATAIRKVHKNWWSSAVWFFQLRERTDRKTNRQKDRRIRHNILHPRKRIDELSKRWIEFKGQVNKRSVLIQTEARKAQTYGRYEQFPDLFSGMLQFDCRSVFGIFDCDKNVKILVQMFPLGFTAHLILLYYGSSKHRQMGCLL